MKKCKDFKEWIKKYIYIKYTFRCIFHIHVHTSVQFSRSVVSDSLPPHKSQHARPPCPLPIPGVHPDSRPLSQ